MRQHVLLDSNVIVDYALQRPDFVENANRIFEIIEAGTLVGYISSSAVTDVYYIVERKMTRGYAWETIEYVYQTLRIIPVIRETFEEHWIRKWTTSRMPFKPQQRRIAILAL